MQNDLRLIINPEADLDLEDIFDYTLNSWGMDQAIKYQKLLYQGMRTIIKQPFIGQQYLSKGKIYYKFKSEHHIIFYKYDDVYCYIVRILHEKWILAQDFHNLCNH